MRHHTILAALGRVPAAGGRPGWRWLLLLPAALLAAVLLGNRRSLLEGLRYLAQLRAWSPAPAEPVRADGPFGVCYALAGSTNAGRLRIIQAALERLGLRAEELPIPGEQLPNLLVRFGAGGPYTLFIAHYDKSRETPTYQGASDNTAAVCALLAAAGDLAAAPPARPVALLFSAAEERGLLGAQAFVRWAQHERFVVAEAINFDMIGRGLLATRPSAQPGYYFWLPLAGELVFDGRTIRRGGAYDQPDPPLVRRLRDALDGRLVVYQRFTAHSDSNVFQGAGIPAVAVSSDDMAYLDKVWERDADRVELLDQANLELARSLIVALSRAGSAELP